MLIWYRADLTHSIQFVKTGTFYIWVEIQKEMILTEKNVLLCATYSGENKYWITCKIGSVSYLKHVEV